MSSHEKDADRAADRALAGLGYKSELPRHMGMLSILGLSFAILAVPFGISTTMYISLTNGQSATALYGWILVTVIAVCVAASLAEICAVYPTAGGVYYWSAMLSNRRWAPLVSFVDGWLALVANWTAVLSINFSGAQLVVSSVALFDANFAPHEWQIMVCFWAMMLCSALVNAFGSRYLPLLNKICIYWTIGSVVVIVATLLAKAERRRPPSFVFAHYDASASGWPTQWSFFVGLLQANYTLSGYGMVATLCEEVRRPERDVPKAMVLSVVVAGLTGVVYLIPLLFVLPEVELLLAAVNNQPIGMVFQTVTGSAAAALCLLLLLIGTIFFAGIGALTAASRCTYAFARDGAIPGYKLWSRVNARLDMPLWALALSTVIDCLLGCIYFGSPAAFNSFTGVATICLITSYGVPITASLVRRREAVKRSPFSLGRFGFVLNVISVAWIALALVIFCMPVSLPVDAGSMNYASVVFAGFAAVAVIWYFVFARRNFKGPPVLRTKGLEQSHESR